MPFGKKVNVFAEIGQQDERSEFFQVHAGVPRQPIFHYFLFAGHLVFFRTNLLITLHS
jgi:hypothetical protein